jgi:conjugative relaxase-like TrwC/TraI family protein
MTWTTSGSKSTDPRPRTRPATTSRPARPAANHPAAGGDQAYRHSASNTAKSSSANRTTCCSASTKAPDGTPARQGSGRKAASIYAQLLAAEPHATAERKRELLLEATRQARQSPLFFDLTLSLSKSISIFHASLGENARLAREAGDAAGDEYWSGLVGEVDAMIWQAVHAGFEYFQREAGYTRTGSHNKRVHGRETGQWHEADLAVAHWLQHTSRDGDMQLHVHSQIAHIARTVIDGKWQAPDSFGYNEHVGAVAAITAQHLEEALTRRFGLEWVMRDDGHSYEVKGISREMMRLFSSRRASITADVRARAERFELRYGRAPSQRELAQASNFATRKGKEGARLRRSRPGTRPPAPRQPRTRQPRARPRLPRAPSPDEAVPSRSSIRTGG